MRVIGLIYTYLQAHFSELLFCINTYVHPAHILGGGC